jgi:hypothetical protein
VENEIIAGCNHDLAIRALERMNASQLTVMRHRSIHEQGQEHALPPSVELKVQSTCHDRSDNVANLIILFIPLWGELRS